MHNLIEVNYAGLKEGDSKGMVSPAVQTRMGNQIGIINVGTTPPIR